MKTNIATLVALLSFACAGLALGQTVYPDGRPSAALRMDAKDQGVILKHGDGPGQCDIRGAREALIFEENGVYHLFYDGAGAKGWLACLATSKDLKTWEKKGPILDFGRKGENDSAAATSPWVYHDGKEWHMFYLGTPNASPSPNFIPYFPYLTMKAKSASLAGPWIKQPEVVPFSCKPNTYYDVTASPGHIVKQGDEYLMFLSVTANAQRPKRTLSIARTKDLNGPWAIDPQPIVSPEEQIENSSLYFEPSNKTWFLFTNHIGLGGGEYTDAVWVYWSKDLNKWDPANKAVVLDGQNCTWSKTCIGMPSVIKVGNRLAVFYDAPGGNSTSHMNRDIGLAWLDLPLVPPVLLSAREVGQPVNLRSEYQRDPLGIDVTNPRLSWWMEEGNQEGNRVVGRASPRRSPSGTKAGEPVSALSPTPAPQAPRPLRVGEARPTILTDAPSQVSVTRGLKQAAYQVLVASTPELLAKDQGDLWDSGRVSSDQSIQVEYVGKPLKSRQECHWKVRMWSQGEKASDWSKPALWVMGLMKPEDQPSPVSSGVASWTAKWIKPGLPTDESGGLNGCFWIWSASNGDFRQTPPGSVYFRTHLNVPADTRIKRASVVMSADNAFVLSVNGKEALKGDDCRKPQTAEITGLLKAGDNTLAVVAANAGGAPSPAGLIGRVTVELADGRKITLETGPAWKAHASGQAGWMDAGFDDASWAAVRVIAKHGDPQAWGMITGQPPQHPWLRRTFELPSGIKSARVFVNTPCLYELFINGEKVGDDVLMPAYAHIQKRAFYNVYDVAQLLQKGTNCIALWMGPGWYQHKNPYGAPIVRAQLEIETQDGSAVIATGGEWRTAESCITQLGSWSWNNFGGERYDAGKYLSNWNLASCDDRSWAKAIEVAAPSLTSSWQALPGNKMDPPIPARSITPFKGKWLIDFGTTLTGWMRLRMDGLKPGQQVVMDYADMLDPNLMFSRNEDGVQTHNQRDIYVAGNEPVGVFQSKFNQHGFRYVVVGGLDKAPDLSDAQAMMVRTHLEPAGEFRCSNELFNRIHEVTVQNTLAQSPTGVMGCGEPREKQGYGDGGSFLTGWIYNFRSDAFFMKWLQDWRDNQEPDGFFGNVAPTTQRGEGGGPSWGGQASELMRRMSLYYGDKTLAGDFYPALKKYVDYLESHTDADILRFFNPFNTKDPKKFEQWQFLGDWTPPGESADKHNFQFETIDQREFFNNCYRILLWQDLANFAGVMGDTAEQKRCEDRLAVLRPLIHKTYYDAGKKNYRVNRQAYLVIALRARIMPEELRPVIFTQLEEDIVVAKKGHLDCGLQGSFMLLDLLVQENRPDLAALIMGQETYPGWGFLVKERKVTTWPETWSGWGSQIIQVVGTPGAWFYEGLAGIRPDPAQPGFKHFSIRPGIVDSVNWVNCHYDSPYGRIVSNWKREDQTLTMEVTVPANTKATIYVPVAAKLGEDGPAKDAAGVTESGPSTGLLRRSSGQVRAGKPAGEADGVEFLRMEANAAVYAVGSGTYHFQSTL